MPARSKAQFRWMFATDQPFARRWARMRAYRRLPARVATKAGENPAAVAAQAGATAPAGNAPANTGTPGKRTPSERARLAALARWGKYKGRGKPKGKGRKPAQTPEAKEAARRQKAQQNRATVATEMGISAEDQASLDALAMGKPPGDTAGLVAAGIVELGKDGTPRLTAAGRQFYNAASRGDAGAAGDALSRGKDKVAPKEDAPAAEAEAEKPKGGGGGGGKEKPTEDEKQAERLAKRAKTAAATAGRVGLTDVDALRAARDEGGADSKELRALGLIDDAGDATDQGRRALTALELGNVGTYRAALQDAKSRMAREAAAQQRKTDKETAAAERAKPAPKEAAKPTTRRTTERRGTTVITTRETKAFQWLEPDAIKQSAQDRAMFANMGGGGGGGGKGGGKPTGGTGGLWKVNPETGKRDPAMGNQGPGRASGTDAHTVSAARSARDAESHKPLARASELLKDSRPDGSDRELREATTAYSRLRTQGAQFQYARDNVAMGGRPITARDRRDLAKQEKAHNQKLKEARTKLDAASDKYEAAQRARAAATKPNEQQARTSYDKMSKLDTQIQQEKISLARNRDARGATPEILARQQQKIRKMQERLDAERTAFAQTGFRTRRDTAGRVVFEPETKGTSMDTLKYSRRHSASDEGLIASTVEHASAILDDMEALGYVAPADEDTDPYTPDALKALDLASICERVSHAVHEALEAAEELDEDGDGMGMAVKGPEASCEVYVYDDYAVACLDDKDIKIGYSLDDAGEVELDEPEDWALVTWGVEEVGDYEDSVKMLSDGRIGGYAVRFGSADEPDLSELRDYFTKSTEFWLDHWATRPMLYHHAQDEATKAAPVVGTWTGATVDSVGVWLEGQLNKAHRYHAAIKELVARGMLKLSSDSAPHLVIRERQANGTNEIKRWPLLAASLTPTPAEPRLMAIDYIKALYAEAGLDLPPVEIDGSPEATDADEPVEMAPDAIKTGDGDLDAVAIELELIEIALLEVA